MSRVAITVVLLAGLSGCSALTPVFSLAGLQEEVDFAEGRGLEGLAKAVETYCAAEGAFTEQRRERLARLNAAMRVAKMSALDCDGNGDPDF